MKYVTDDGQEFLCLDLAEEHERELEQEKNKKFYSNIVFKDFQNKEINFLDFDNAFAIITKDKKLFTNEEIGFLENEIDSFGLDYDFDKYNNSNIIYYNSSLQKFVFFNLNELSECFDKIKLFFEEVSDYSRNKESKITLPSYKKLEKIQDLLITLLDY